jgi:hypothetical protein
MREVEEYAQPGDDAAARAVHRAAHEAVAGFGARVTWQRLQEQARQGHGNPEAFALIGEAVFWYMDELAASCSAGYAEAKAELAGETSQLRRHLLDLLTSGPAPPFPAVASLAQAAGWPLPRRLHVHPQTIRYRLRQVSELFGEALHDPDDRFRLLLALRVRGLLGG